MASGWGLVTRRPNHSEKLGIFQPHPQPPEKGEGLEVELTIDHGYVRIPILGVTERFQIGEHIHLLRCDTSRLYKDRHLLLGPFQTLPCVYLHLTVS